MFGIVLLIFTLNLSNADCLIEKDSTVITQTQKGNVETYRFLKIKILTERGRDFCGDIKIRYDRKASRFKILKAYTLLPDGKKVKVEKDAIMDVGAPETAIAPQYTTRIIKAVSFPALKENAEIVYEYVIKSRKPSKEPLFGTSLFRARNPIAKKILILNIPESRNLKYRKVNSGNITIKIDTTKPYLRYIFESENVEKLPDEEFTPPLMDIVPRIDYTEFNDESEMAEWLFEKFKDKIETGKKIEELAKTLKGEDEISTFYRVMEYVQEKIQSINLYLWDAGFVPHSATWVLKHRYGDVRDKAVLALSLLKTLGIKAEPLIVEVQGVQYSATVGLSSVLSEKSLELPVPSLYKTMIIRAILKDTVLYAPLMEKYSDITFIPADIQGKRAFSFWEGNGSYLLIPVLSPQSSELYAYLKGNIGDDGSFTGSWQIEGTGMYSGRLRSRFRFKKDKEIKVMLENLIKVFGQTAKLDSYRLSNMDSRWESPSLLIFISSKDFANINGNLEFTIPILPFSTRYATRSKRELPLYIGAPRKVIYSSEISVPVDFSPFILPDSVKRDNKYNTLISRITYKNHRVKFNSEYTTNKIQIPVNDYAKFREVEGLFFSKNERSVILSK